MYADTRAPVEKTIDEEAPLLVSYDGIEFSSGERPSKILLGRASFKLKISQVRILCMNICYAISSNEFWQLLFLIPGEESFLLESGKIAYTISNG